MIPPFFVDSRRSIGVTDAGYSICPVDLPLKAGANRWTFCFQWETGELFYRWRLSSSWELWLFARRIKSQLK